MITSLSFPTPPFGLFLFSSPVSLSCPSSVIRWHIWQPADLFVSRFSSGVNSSVTNGLLHTLRWSWPLCWRDRDTKEWPRQKWNWFLHVNRWDSRALKSALNKFDFLFVRCFFESNTGTQIPVSLFILSSCLDTCESSIDNGSSVCVCVWILLCQYLSCSRYFSHDCLINTQ